MENNNPEDVEDVISLDNIEEANFSGNQGAGQAPNNLPTDPPVPPANQPPAGTPPANEPPAGDPPADEDDVIATLIKDDSFLSAEDKTLKQTILSTFGASNIDAKGNLLNDKGQVVLTAQDLDKYVDTGEMNLDAQGNLINALGEIVSKAGELPNSNPFDNTVKAVSEEYGFQFVGEGNQPKSYSNDDAGRKEFIDDVVMNTSQVAVSAFLEDNPATKDFFLHLQNGGTADSFANRAVDYTSVDVNELSKEEKLAYIKQSFEKQGLKNGTSMLKLIEGAGEEQLAQSTSEALLTLTELTAEEKARNEAAYAKQLEDNAKANTKYWDNVESVIKQGKLKDLSIPETQRADFFKYIASPINGKGDTQERLDAEKEDVEFNLLVSYLRYNKYDLSKLVNDRAGISKRDRFKERFNNPNPRIESTNQRTSENNQQTGGSYTPKIEDILG